MEFSRSWVIPSRHSSPRDLSKLQPSYIACSACSAALGNFACPWLSILQRACIICCRCLHRRHELMAHAHNSKRKAELGRYLYVFIILWITCATLLALLTRAKARHCAVPNSLMSPILLCLLLHSLFFGCMISTKVLFALSIIKLFKNSSERRDPFYLSQAQN